MGAASRVRAYYDALRDGDPLYPYFAPDETVVKFGVSETLRGYEEVEAALREQSRTTADWTVESRELRVTERDRHAWFADVVDMGWTNVERGVRQEFETRWSGTLERERRGRGESDDAPGDWRFVGMHVSTAGDL
ncbi:MAG: nuclear transport factor 2 family protein [Haloarculaceae archaeon]